jgi:nitrate reductase NapE component
MLFIILILAHIIGDFFLQPTYWVLNKEAKKEKSIYLYYHLGIHFLLAIAFVGKLDFVLFGLLLTAFHGLIDVAKLRLQNSTNKRTWFFADQILHVISILAISLWYSKTEINIESYYNYFWIIGTAIAFLGKPTSLLIKNAISIWTPKTEIENNDESLQNAGNFIGILERLFILCFILTNHFEAIGFLLAAKSIFRFGDLKEAKDRKLTEYVLIGTLLSFGIAILIGLLCQFAFTF